MKPLKRITPSQALQRLEDLCARSEQCTSEAEAKLYRWGIARPDRETIIASLHENRYIDDSRYARAYVRDRLTFAHWGRRKISAALSMKRIPHPIVAEALDQIDEKEYRAIAYNVMRAKIKSTGSIDTKEEYMKLLRTGIQRGFETDLVAKAIKQILSEDEDMQ